MGATCNVVESDIGKDIVRLYDIELGSYGYRKLGNAYFAYGTGLALPRFSFMRHDGVVT